MKGFEISEMGDRELRQLVTFTHRGPTHVGHLHVASCHAWLSGHLYASTYTLLPTAIMMEGPSKETVQRKPNFFAKLKDIYKGTNIFKPSVRKMRRNAGVGKRHRLHCRQGLLSGNQYPGGSKTENTTTPIDNGGDSSKGSGVAATSECFHPKSLQRSMNRQTYSGCTV